jgi:lysine-arginine-ornithine-binding protein
MKLTNSIFRTAVVALSLSIAGGMAAADDMTIRWGTEAGYKPFMFKDSDGNLVGFDYDIGEAICAELKATCTWVEQDWDGIIPGLMANRYDAILASMTDTPDRRRAVDFTDKYYSVPVRFVASAEAGFESVDDLAGRTVGVQRGTSMAQYLRENHPDVTVKEYPTTEEVWLDLASGRVDASLGTTLVIVDGFLNTDAGAGFAMFGPDYSNPEYFGVTSIAIRKGDAELAEAINGAIKALRASGTYQEINAKYFDFDIYGAE